MAAALAMAAQDRYPAGGWGRPLLLWRVVVAGHSRGAGRGPGCQGEPGPCVPSFPPRSSGPSLRRPGQVFSQASLSPWKECRASVATLGSVDAVAELSARRGHGGPAAAEPSDGICGRTVSVERRKQLSLTTERKTGSVHCAPRGAVRPERRAGSPAAGGVTIQVSSDPRNRTGCGCLGRTRCAREDSAGHPGSAGRGAAC